MTVPPPRAELLRARRLIAVQALVGVLAGVLVAGLTTVLVVLWAQRQEAARQVDTVVATRIQLDTREDMRGRVLATMGIVSSLSGMVGAPVVGWLADALGARGGLILGGVVTTVWAVGGAVALGRAAGVVVPGVRQTLAQPA